MSKYIWVNPVAEKMYGKDISKVEEHLKERGYILATCDPQLEYVRNQYQEYGKDAENVILDCRCPASIDLLRKEDITDNFEIPSIEPILVRSSRVMYDKYVKNDDDVLIITCPCTQLRDYTKKRLEGKDNVTIYTWKEFIEAEGMYTLGSTDKSPIPLGFFRQAFENVLELSGRDEIVQGIKNIRENNEKNYNIVEMLYCKDGCNNGDGL